MKLGNYREIPPWGRIASGIALLALALATTSTAQEVSDAALKDRVAQLVGRLDSEKAETRTAAQAGLIKLGARILPLLPETSKTTKPETVKRLAEIRAALSKADEEVDTKPSRVTIEGKGIRLSEAIQQLQKQSKNLMTDLRDPSGAGTTNPALDLEIRDQPFFEALGIIARKGGVSLNYATGDGSIGLMEGAATGTPVREMSGPFMITLTRIGLFREVTTGVSSANVQLEVAWEPRLRPMLLALKADKLEVIDDRGKPVPPQIDKEATEVVLRPENPSAEINLSLAAPDRAARKLASLKLTADVTIPAGIKTFRFPNLTEEGAIRTIGEVRVSLKGTEVEENVWKVNVELAYPGGGPVFQSYQQGLFNNRIWLQKADGSKFEQNGGFSTATSGEGVLGFEYEFVDAPGKPGDYQLVYETPSKIITIPVQVTFKDVILP